jgi:hypothetical protein
LAGAVGFCGGASTGPSVALGSAFGSATGFGLQPTTPIINVQAKIALSLSILVMEIFPRLS